MVTLCEGLLRTPDNQFRFPERDAFIAGIACQVDDSYVRCHYVRCRKCGALGRFLAVFLGPQARGSALLLLCEMPVSTRFPLQLPHKSMSERKGCCKSKRQRACR